MPALAEEKSDGRRVTTGNQPSAEIAYHVSGAADEYEARQAIIDVSPATYDPLGSGVLYIARVSVRVELLGGELWDGVALYGTLPQTEEATEEFDTGGTTQHITVSKRTSGRYAAPGKTASDYHGAIGDDGKGNIEGCDIPVRAYHWSETHYLADVDVTDEYKALLHSLSGTVNTQTFKGFAPGANLFLGAVGHRRGLGDWEIRYSFAAMRNVEDATIGPFTNVWKKGWEYIWFEFESVLDSASKRIVRRPIAAYVEEVLDGADHNLLGI